MGANLSHLEGQALYDAARKEFSREQTSLRNAQVQLEICRQDLDDWLARHKDDPNFEGGSNNNNTRRSAQSRFRSLYTLDYPYTTEIDVKQSLVEKAKIHVRQATNAVARTRAVVEEIDNRRNEEIRLIMRMTTSSAPNGIPSEIAIRIAELNHGKRLPDDQYQHQNDTRFGAFFQSDEKTQHARSWNGSQEIDIDGSDTIL